jgi:hypothetical protein
MCLVPPSVRIIRESHNYLLHFSFSQREKGACSFSSSHCSLWENSDQCFAIHPSSMIIVKWDDSSGSSCEFGMVKSLFLVPNGDRERERQRQKSLIVAGQSSLKTIVKHQYLIATLIPTRRQLVRVTNIVLLTVTLVDN